MGLKTIKIKRFFALPITVFCLIIVLIIVILFAGFSLAFKSRGVKIITQQTEYGAGDSLKLKTENFLGKDVCFSACYPYYIESKEAGWAADEYSQCSVANLAEKCLAPKEMRALESFLPNLNKGTYRLAVPVCVGCNAQEAFKPDRWFYSNEFIIK